MPSFTFVICIVFNEKPTNYNEHLIYTFVIYMNNGWAIIQSSHNCFVVYLTFLLLGSAFVASLLPLIPKINKSLL